jgi:anti-sigma regulatory factor (Ser/Thr protein kinase)
VGSDETTTANGRAPASPDQSELETLRARCDRQALAIDKLGEWVSSFRRGAQALKTENSRLRVENDRLSRSRRPASENGDRRQRTELTESAIPLGIHAPGLARQVVSDCLADRVSSGALETALLLVSELVANSVRHSGALNGDDVVVRVHLWGDHCRLEVQDSGRGGVIAPQPLELGKSGLGLHLVQTLSERWGVVQAVEGPTRVWAQLSCSAELE